MGGVRWVGRGGGAEDIGGRGVNTMSSVNEILIKIATSKFGGLSMAEHHLLAAFPMGEVAMPIDDKSESIETKKGQIWPKEREILAVFNRWICMEENIRKYVSPQGIRIGGSRIVGLLDLQYLLLPFPLHFLSCGTSGKGWKHDECFRVGDIFL